MTNVLFNTLWHDFSDGWSIASRAYARAMKQAGLGVKLHSWMGALEEPSPEVLAEVKGMLEEKFERDLLLFSCTLSSAERAAYSIDTLIRTPKPRAFYTMFERTAVEPATCALLNQCDGVFVPCSANLKALRKAGSTNATYIPYPYFPDDPHLTLPPPRREPKVFYWIGRWEPRKAPHNLLRAFLQAFKPGEAELHLKLGPVPWEGYPGPEECLRGELLATCFGPHGQNAQHVAKAIHIHRGRWSPAEMLAFHAQGDVYVSASRGEGIDLPAFAAKLGGRRVVTTDSGGPRDFLTETDILVPAKGTVPPAPRYQWGPGATFADYELNDLVSAMQRARMDTRTPERISTRFHAHFVGQQLKAWVEDIVARVPRERPAGPQLSGFASWLNEEED